MRQVIQSYKTGKLSLDEMPVPAVSSVGVLVRNERSAVSPGTERMIIDLAKKSMLGKAAARPDLVKQVLGKVRSEGLWSTFQKVQSKLETPIPLGYSCAGIIEQTGAFVEELRPGDRVACGGAGYANHAEFNHVPRNLCAKIPEGVSMEEASFTTIGSIALQGVRQAELRLGDRVAVIGLGLIGQIAAQLVKAAGCQVLGSDIDKMKLDLALKLGADQAVDGSQLVAAAESFSQGMGVDTVIITAADKSSKLMEVAAQISRMKAKVVVVGLVGMDIPRDLYYKKELDIRLSMSYGPGRYDPVYEEGGVDYPYPFVRWTEGRNMQAILALLAQGKLQIAPIITHRIALEDILNIYDMMLKGTESSLGVVIEYPEEVSVQARSESIVLQAVKSDRVNLAVVGAGNFAKGVLLPILKKTDGVTLDTVCTQTGMSGLSTAKQFGFGTSTTNAQSIFESRQINAVLIATRHDLHADLISQALAAGKHVFTEKPLAILPEHLDRIVSEVKQANQAGNAPVVMVGFNRRYSPHALRIREIYANRGNPLVMQYRLNAGYIPTDSWVHDPLIGGGRIIGEVCHFVDTLRFIADSPIVRVQAEAIAPQSGNALSSDNISVDLRFADGSIANILYTALGGSGLAKERLEVHGDKSSAVLDDYRNLTLYRSGRVSKEITGAQDKGHRKELETFVAAVKGEETVDFGVIAEVTRVTFGIVESIRSGQVIKY